jgi:hypothetical protein
MRSLSAFRERAVAAFRPRALAGRRNLGKTAGQLEETWSIGFRPNEGVGKAEEIAKTIRDDNKSRVRNNLQKGDLDYRVTLFSRSAARRVPPNPWMRSRTFLLRKPAMENPTKKQVVRRAYELWEQAGKPDGKDEEFYHLAEQELRDTDKSSPLRTPDNL